MNWNHIIKDKESFLNNPQMYGHFLAQKSFRKANAIISDPKLNKTKIQKYIIRNSFRFDDKVSWNYFFTQLTDKYLALVKHALKKVNKSNIVDEYKWISARTGMLRSSLEKALAVLAYKLDKDKYLLSEAKIYMSYGMNKSDAIRRAEKVVKLMEKRLNYKW